MTAARRSYTRRQKAALVGQSEVEGVRKTARSAGVPVSTLESWRNRGEFAQLRTERRDEVAQDVWAAFQAGVRRIAELIPITEDMGKVAVATGILYDKYALMSGEATTRSEHRDVTANMGDHEKAALADAIDEWLRVKP